ncbi:MAG: hypothetical protein QXK06_01750 [Candidatus Diapherotrites archaeon]
MLERFFESKPSAGIKGLKFSLESKPSGKRIHSKKAVFRKQFCNSKKVKVKLLHSRVIARKPSSEEKEKSARIAKNLEMLAFKTSSMEPQREPSEPVKVIKKILAEKPKD